MAATGSKRKAAYVKGIPRRLEDRGELGLGAMTHPETECWIARSILFRRMEKALVKELRSLRDNSLPHYRALLHRGRETLPGDHSDFPAMVIREMLPNNAERLRRHYVTDWSSLKQAAEHYKEAKDLSTTISNWSVARYMMADWFLDSILGNLCVWSKIRGAVKVLPWSYAGVLAGGESHRVGPDAQRLHGWGALDHQIDVPVVKPYNPSTQTREEHQREVQVALNRYHAKQEDLFAAAGFENTISKRARASKDPWLHFDWFIQYQIQERSGSEIAQKYRKGNLEESAIHHALRPLARILQVTLRAMVNKRLRVT
jgi:hypothetical protein